MEYIRLRKVSLSSLDASGTVSFSSVPTSVAEVSPSGEEESPSASETEGRLELVSEDEGEAGKSKSGESVLPVSVSAESWCLASTPEWIVDSCWLAQSVFQSSLLSARNSLTVTPCYKQKDLNLCFDNTLSAAMVPTWWQVWTNFEARFVEMAPLVYCLSGDTRLKVFNKRPRAVEE